MAVSSSERGNEPKIKLASTLLISTTTGSNRGGRLMSRIDLLTARKKFAWSLGKSLEEGNRTMVVRSISIDTLYSEGGGCCLKDFEGMETMQLAIQCLGFQKRKRTTRGFLITDRFVAVE